MTVRGREHAVQILRLTPSLSLEVTMSLPTLFSPVTLQGDLVGLGNYVLQSAIWNWKTSSFSSLDEEPAPEQLNHTTYSPGAEDDEVGTINPIYNMYLSREHVFVARAYTLTLFAMPQRFHPSLDAAASDANVSLAKHSFGCVDAICMTQTGTTNGGLPAYRLLVRGFSDDAWKNRDDHVLQVYTLDSDPSSPSYRFPPRLEARIPTKYGRLKCRDVFLGNAGVALWTQPKERCWRPFGYEDTEREYIYAAILPDSPYRSAGSKGGSSSGCEFYPFLCLVDGNSSTSDLLCVCAVMERRHDGSVKLNPILLKTNHDSESNWTCMDWDEATGRIALGLQDGCVTLVEM